MRYGVNQIRYAKGMSYFYCSLHAEADLLKKCSPDEIRGAKVFVYRFNNTSADDARQPKCSMPCHLCQHNLKQAGISRVYCINSKGEITVMRKEDMVTLSDHPSSITKHFLRKFGKSYHGKFQSKDYLAKCA